MIFAIFCDSAYSVIEAKDHSEARVAMLMMMGKKDYKEIHTKQCYSKDEAIEALRRMSASREGMTPQTLILSPTQVSELKRINIIRREDGMTELSDTKIFDMGLIQAHIDTVKKTFKEIARDRSWQR